MSTDGTPNSPNESTPSPSPTAAPTGEAEWRAGPQSRFAGKSKEEILGIAEGLAVVAERFNQPVPQPQVEAPRNRFDLDIPDDGLVEGRHVKQLFQHLANQPMPVDYVARQQTLSLTVNAVKQAYPEEFKKWGAEIEREWRGLDQAYWNVDTLSKLVRFVRGEHVDELAAEQAQRLLDKSHPTIRSGSGGSGSVSQEQPSIFESGDPDLLASLRGAGIQNEGDIRRACDSLGGISPEQFVAEFRKRKRGDVIYG
jgi:hypothetical protein